MSIVTPQDEAAAIFLRIFEALARQCGKTLAASTRADIARACELLTQAGGDLDELLDDIPLSEPPRRSPGEQAIDDPRFDRWRAARVLERD